MSRYACLTVLALLGAAVGGVGACPTLLNLIPSAQVLERGAMSLQVEADGDPSPFASGVTSHLFTQFGFGSRLEAGVDVVNLNGDEQYLWNAKWQLLAETDRRPAVAVGSMDITHQTGERQWYLVATDSLDDGRTAVTAGYAHNGANRGMVGVSRALDDRWTLYADWTTGPAAFATLGTARSLGGGWCGLLYYARGNSSRDDDFVGLNLSWTGSYR